MVIMANAECDTELVKVRVTKDQAAVLSRIAGGDGVHSIERLAAVLLHNLVDLAKRMDSKPCNAGAADVTGEAVSGRRAVEVVHRRPRRRRSHRPAEAKGTLP